MFPSAALRSLSFGLFSACLGVLSCSPSPTPHTGDPVPKPLPPPLPTAAAVATSTATAVATSDPTPTEPPSKWAKCETAPADMVCIPGGNAVLGSTTSPNEGPVHTVEVSTFYVDKYEVRNRDYEACEKAKACPERIKPDATFMGPDQPAVPLQWGFAHAYCVWAGKRMLTEAEWEKVARGGEEARVYPWGDAAPSCDKAQYKGCTPDTTKNVGSFPAGPYGVFDMAGNGYEWVSDWYSPCFGGCDRACGTACQGQDPLGVCSGARECKASAERTLKGGSWYWPADQMRGSHRRGQAPKSKVHRLSVRCASTSPDLATHPAKIVASPLPVPAAPTAPTAEQLTMFRDLTEDTDVFKIPLCAKNGEATHSCRDPHSYVSSNEPEQHLFAPYIKNLGGGYAGVGSDQAYTFMAQARSEWAWLFDYDPTVVRIHYILRGVILASPTKEAFVAAFEGNNVKTTLAAIKKSFGDAAFIGGKPLSASEVDATERTFSTGRGPLHDVYSRALKSGHEMHWLRSDEAYKHIRTLYQQGRIVAIKGNLLTTVAIPSIAASAKKLGVTINVYYTSNADDQWPLNQAYKDSLTSLPFGPMSVMIHTTIPEGRGKKVHDWDYVVHAGTDIQRRLKQPGWDRIVWFNDEGIRPAPKLVTIALPSGKK